MAAVALIAESEGLRLTAYRCPAGVPTIGWGETSGVHMGDTCTKEDADRWLCEDLTDRCKAIRAVCKVQPSPNELGALVSLAYNIPWGSARNKVSGFITSTVLKQHNAGNRDAAARAFGLWNKARVNGVLTVLPGLEIRRAKEKALYLTPENAASEPMPQAVEAESKLRKSPMAQAAAVIVGAPVVELATQASEGVGALKPAIAAVKTLATETLGIPTQWVVPVLLIVAGLIVLRWRLRQRSEGYA